MKKHTLHSKMMCYKFHSILYFSGMTMQELISVVGISRSAAYRRLNRLITEGYIEKACKSINADTFCITQKGVEIVTTLGGTIEDVKG